MSVLALVSAEGIQEKTRHNFLHVWAQKAKRKFSSKGSMSEIKSDIDIQMHHLAGTVEFIIKQAAHNPENKNNINKIKNKINKVLEEGYRLQHANDQKDKAELEVFLVKVKQVRAKFQDLEQQRKHSSKSRSSGGGHFGFWDAVALSSVLSALTTIIR